MSVQKLQAQDETNKDVELVLDLSDKATQIGISRKIVPIMSALLKKIHTCFDAQSILNLPDGQAISFFEERGNTLIFRCGANLQIELPKTFLATIGEKSPDMIDFLIRDWRIVFNGIDIPVTTWFNNPGVTSEQLLTIVPEHTTKLLHTNKSGSIKGRIDRLMKKLLPEKEENQSTGKSLLLHQGRGIRFPKLEIYKK